MANKELIDILIFTGRLSCGSDKDKMFEILDIGKILIESKYNIDSNFRQFDKLGIPVEENLYLLYYLIASNTMCDEVFEIVYRHIKLISETFIFDTAKWMVIINEITDKLYKYKKELDEKNLKYKERLKNFEHGIQLYDIDLLGYTWIEFLVNNIKYKITLNRGLEFNSKTYNVHYGTNKIINGIRSIRINTNKIRFYKNKLNLSDYTNSIIVQ